MTPNECLISVFEVTAACQNAYPSGLSQSTYTQFHVVFGTDCKAITVFVTDTQICNDFKTKEYPWKNVWHCDGQSA